MSGIGTLNLKVVVLDSDYYALQAINSYLAWDRRTRVVFLGASVERVWSFLFELPQSEFPDVIVMDADHLGGAHGLHSTIRKFREHLPGAMLVCLSQSPDDPDLVMAAAKAGAKAFLLKQDVQLQIAWAICYALEHDMVISEGIARVAERLPSQRLLHATILPDQREYPEMSDRIRQAIKLCVIEGMPAHLAADEMGISLHTIRGYIKDGYRILESYDHTDYPSDMTPQERAFMRFTAFVDDDMSPPLLLDEEDNFEE